jgi:hypothetical protein
MKFNLIYFLVRYWFLVMLTPSIVVPTFSFFYNFTDIADFSLSEIGFEIIKYLIPAILIFSAVSILIAFLFILADLLLLRVMIKKLQFWTFKITFIVLSSLFIVTPALLWHWFQNIINFNFIEIVIPSYVLSGIFWGAVLTSRKTYNVLKLSSI